MWVDLLQKRLSLIVEGAREFDTATLYYYPPDAMPTPEQLESAAKLLGIKFFVIETKDHPGESPSTWVIDPELGFVYLQLEQPLPEQTIKGYGLTIVIEPNTVSKDNAS